MLSYLYVGLGGAIGACLRYFTGVAVGNGLIATLFVNVLGSAILGGLMAWLASRQNAEGEALYLLVAVGVLGAFTTFSTFSRETVHLMLNEQILQSFAYMAANLCGAVGAFAVAFLVTRGLLN